VFHHNIRSVDHGEDFLDPKYLQIIKRHGFDLCLHGHVHSASHDIFDPLQAKMLPVVGAGSLAAPYTDRPPATPMGYNLIVINRETGGIWVHTRRHDENNLVWAPDYQWQGKPYFVVRGPSRPTNNVVINKLPVVAQSPGSQAAVAAGATKPAGIPAELYMRIRQALLDCGPFDDDRQMRAVFAHPLLSPWQNGLPQADTRVGRVDGVIDYLRSRKRSDTGDNALGLLLQVLVERTDPGDECHGRLAGLTDELRKTV
jgi:hypothetical protein